jgi:tRNA U34 5-carboxymethylaminomethyl modifying enzyme MnmG/GidA
MGMLSYRKEIKMDTSTYISILTDTLIKKSKVLDELIVLNKEQEVMLVLDEVNLDFFDETLNMKEKLIKQLNQLDDGFEMMYARVQDELINNIDVYKANIVAIQELIKNIMEKSANLHIKEKNIKLKFETYLMKQKQEIKNYKMNSQSVSNYYKNMMNEYQGESYFLDKKK